jgi:hypothetical protein
LEIHPSIHLSRRTSNRTWMTMPFNTSTSTISNTTLTPPPMQEAPAQGRILETVVDMDLVDSTIKEAPPVTKLTDVIIRVLEIDVLCGRAGETNHIRNSEN